jgi:2-dehydro-3-deoxyglucarate aldolase/4-hydroxy-2-oxoheptanedioate aldolase
MRPNPVKRALAAGHTVIGTMVFEFSTTGIARLAAGAGAQFVVFDMEHTGWSMETIRMLMATSAMADTVPIVRVPAAQYHFLARVLDLGAMGVMVPMVSSADQARLIVESSKYPPHGRRGSAFTIAHDDYRDGPITTKMQSGNEEGLVIAQIETVEGLEHVEEIAAVHGIDMLWIGQFDLTAALGIPGQFEHPRHESAVERILVACRQYGKAPAILATDMDQARTYLAQGFRCLAYHGDLWLYASALKAGMETLRSELAAKSPGR